MTLDHRQIRQFIMESFDDEELRDLCLDYFAEVYHDFTVGMRKSQMVRELVSYCLRRQRMLDLMAALERERDIQYRAWFGEEASTPGYRRSPHPQPQRNPRLLFLSYAHQDAALAARLAADLKAHGWPVWIAPDSIEPGEKWVEAINRGLEECGLFVPLLTPAAVDSRWVRNEMNVAIELEAEGHLRLIPLEVEPGRLPPLWRVYQRIPFASTYDADLNRLLAELEQKAAGSTPPSLPDAPAPSPAASPEPADRRLSAIDGKEMVRIPAGEFLYGPHKVPRSLPEFWIDRTPVTNAEYARFVKATGRHMPRHWHQKMPDELLAEHPVVQITWHDATAYAQWSGKRLPSEEEWEKAARGTDGREYPWGDEWQEGRCNSVGVADSGTVPVGTYSPDGDSPYGCSDMCGNIWEWVNSDYGPGLKVLRGGGWGNNKDNYRISRRSGNQPSRELDIPFGIRCASDP